MVPSPFQPFRSRGSAYAFCRKEGGLLTQLGYLMISMEATGSHIQNGTFAISAICLNLPTSPPPHPASTLTVSQQRSSHTRTHTLFLFHTQTLAPPSPTTHTPTPLPAVKTSVSYEGKNCMHNNANQWNGSIM